MMNEEPVNQVPQESSTANDEGLNVEVPVQDPVQPPVEEETSKPIVEEENK